MQYEHEPNKKLEISPLRSVRSSPLKGRLTRLRIACTGKPVNDGGSAQRRGPQRWPRASVSDGRGYFGERNGKCSRSHEANAPNRTLPKRKRVQSFPGCGLARDVFDGGRYFNSRRRWHPAGAGFPRRTRPFCNRTTCDLHPAEETERGNLEPYVKGSANVACGQCSCVSTARSARSSRKTLSKLKPLKPTAKRLRPNTMSSLTTAWPWKRHRCPHRSKSPPDSTQRRVVQKISSQTMGRQWLLCFWKGGGGQEGIIIKREDGKREGEKFQMVRECFFICPPPIPFQQLFGNPSFRFL